MVRYADPPGTVKHIRFNYPNSELLDPIKSFPGVKAIVLHRFGKSGEHPHLHVWYETSTPVTNQTVRNHLCKHHAIFKTLSGQHDWSFRNHDSFSAWATYVCRNISHQVLLDYQDLAQVSHSNQLRLTIPPERPPEVPHLTTPVVRIKSRLTQSEKLIQYCQQTLQWSLNHQFNLPQYEEPLSRSEVIRQVQAAVCQFTRGRFNDPQAVSLARNVLYEFSDDDLRAVLESIFFKNVKNFLQP